MGKMRNMFVAIVALTLMGATRSIVMEHNQKVHIAALTAEKQELQGQVNRLQDRRAMMDEQLDRWVIAAQPAFKARGMDPGTPLSGTPDGLRVALNPCMAAPGNTTWAAVTGKCSGRPFQDFPPIKIELAAR